MKQQNDCILMLNQLAQEKIKKGEKVTNGTIGMMYLDDGSLPIYPSIRSTLAKHVQDEDLIYSSVAGEEDYRNLLINWFWGNHFDEALASKNMKVISTLGGTGAVSISIRESTLKNGLLLLPSLAWPNYQTMANCNKAPFVFYDNFNEKNGFNIEGIKKIIEESIGKYSCLSLIVNDPCQNPTGFCMTEKEWHDLVALLNEYTKKIGISLIFDVAYIDFADDISRKYIADSVKSLDKSITSYICMSFSKTFSFYGLRIGALAIYSNDKNDVENADLDCRMLARSYWSTPNHMAMNSISDLLHNEESVKILKEDIRKNKDLVLKRSKIFLKEAKKNGLSWYPYGAGFFISIKVKDANKVADTLAKKNVFIAPIKDDVLRIAICCMPTNQIYGLAKLIKDAQ